MDCYYTTPIVIDGVWAKSLADYEMYVRVTDREQARLDKMTIDLKMFIKDMVREETIERIFTTYLLE